MVGYSPKSPEYLVYDPTSQKMRSAYSVIFHEDICGFPNKRVNTYGENYEDVIDNYGPEIAKCPSHDVFNTKQDVEIQQVFRYIVRYVSCRMMNEWLPTSG